jgi:hypothetical protein
LIFDKNNELDLVTSFTDELYCHRGSISDVNSLGFRSEEFKKVHKGKHILFSGCSNTYGSGLKLNEIWASRVYKNISEKEECSGFFNLSVPGAGINHICFNLFRYFKTYGNPDTIFLNLTNQIRFFWYDEFEESYRLKLNSSEDFRMLKFLNFQYYFMLEQYCKSNNIQLLSFTWDHFYQYSLFSDFKKDIEKSKYFENSTNQLFKKYNFETFYPIDLEEMIEGIIDLSEYHEKRYFLVARDNIHQGTGMHHWWSNFIYEKYLELNKD